MNISVGRWYDKRSGKEVCEKRGPKVRYSDTEVLKALESYLKEPVFYNEGYKKLKIRLSDVGIEVGKERLRRIMNEKGLLLTGNQRERRSPYEHTGIIITDRPNKMWGSDIKEFHLSYGKIYFISLKDHYHGKITGHYVSQDKTTWSVMEALRNSIRNEFGSLDKGVCKGLEFQIRQDNGTQYVSDKYRMEAEYLGITLSNTMVRSPESNGIIERFHRTMNEQLGEIKMHKTFEESKALLDSFVDKFNAQWLYHRHNLKSPLKIEKAYTGNLSKVEGVPP